MKNYISLGFILIHFFSYCQKKELTSKSNNTLNSDSLIQIIRRNVAKINSESTSQKLIKENIEGESAEGGKIKKFFRDNSLDKGVIEFYGETGKDVKEFYFVNSELIFLFEKEYHYNEPISEAKSSISSVTENRFYFYNNKLFHWLNNKKTVNEDKYDSKMTEILSDLKKYFKL
jgi:hypothetical protein